MLPIFSFKGAEMFNRTCNIQANSAFDTYRELYFEGGVSSVYLWDVDEGFAGVVLIKKGVNFQTLNPFSAALSRLSFS